MDQRFSLLCDGREFTYYFRPAVEANSPILIIFHGHEYGARPASWRNDKWNVVCPMDAFGEGAKGSWYLGEHGDYFWLTAIPRLIAHIRTLVGDVPIYFWGSSMGGYAALLHGYLNNAKMVYANVPQTRLLGSSYSEYWMKTCFEHISTEASPYNNLKDVFSSPCDTLFFLVFNQLEKGDYFKEQGLDFITHLQSIGQKFYLEVRPNKKHGKNHGITETIELFEKYAADEIS